MNTLEQLLVQLDTTAWRLGREEAVPLAAIQRLLREAEALGPSLDPAGRAALLARMARLGVAAAQAHHGLARRIDSLGAGRRAVSGYLGASPAPTSRRLRRRA